MMAPGASGGRVWHVHQDPDSCPILGWLTKPKMQPTHMCPPCPALMAVTTWLSTPAEAGT